MALELIETRPAATDDIERLVQTLGVALPDDYVEFIQKYDGLRPQPNVFEIGKDDDAGVNGFIPVREIPKELQRVDLIEESQFPFAWVECGNYAVLDAMSGSVYFWDHELDSLHQLSTSFSGFLDILQPFDPNSVELDMSRIISVWIDPEFFETVIKKQNKK